MRPIQAGQPNIQGVNVSATRFSAGTHIARPLFGSDEEAKKPQSEQSTDKPEQAAQKDTVEISQGKAQNQESTKQAESKPESAQDKGAEKKSVESQSEAEAPKSAPKAADSPKASQSSQQAQQKSKTSSKKESRFFGSNSRQAAGILFSRIVPLLLSLPLAGGVPGFMIFMAGFPLSYLSGKFGRSLMKDVDQTKLSPIFQHYSKLEAALTNPQNLKSGEVVDHYNNAKDELFNLIKLPLVTDFLKKNLTLSKAGGLGKLLNNFTMLKANIYSDVAQADNVQKAAAAGIKGGLNYVVYFQLCRKIGKAIKVFAQAPWVPFKGMVSAAGTMLENLWLAKLAVDATRRQPA